MPSASDRMRNNVKAGLFVIITIVIALAVIFVLGDVKRLFGGPVPYSVTFTVENGIKNLSGGADVRVGGISMGRVTKVILLKPDDPDAPARTIEVMFTLARDVRLYSNARITINSPLIGADAWLDITTLGGTDLDTTASMLDKGDRLVGASGGTMLATLLGPNAGRIDNIIANVESGTEFFADLDDLYKTDVLPILDNVEQTTGNANEFVADFRENTWPTWADQVSQIMQRATELGDNIDKALANADGLMQDSRDVIGENRESIARSVTNIESTTENAKQIAARVQDETIDKVHALLSTGQDGLDQAVSVLNSVRTDYDGWSPRINDTLTNATLMSQQLKLAGMEVRRSPWKLLYRPNSGELEHELLYEAARSFALAATDLKAASTAANRMLNNHSDRLRENPELMQKVTENLIDPLEQYERAQTRLFDILKLEQ